MSTIFRASAACCLVLSSLAAIPARSAPGDAAPKRPATAAKETAAKPAAPAPAGEQKAEDRKIDPLDWPAWRGPEQNGVSRETGLVEMWEVDGENMLWKSEALGGRSTPIVMNGRLYTIVAAEPHTPRQGEKVVCADAATGEVLWESRFNVFSSDVPVERVGWGCCAGDPTTGRVYAQSVCGLVLCLEGATGDIVWQRSLSEEMGLLSTYGGRTNMPVLFEDLVIINAVFINWGATDPTVTYQAFAKNIGGWGDMAKPAHRYLAMNKATGETVWFNGTRLLPEDTTYSTPTVTTLGGQAALVFGAGDGSVYAMQPRTGNIIWKFDLSIRGLNVSPLVVGDTVYTGQSEENYDDSSMGALCAINGVGSGDISKSGELWRIKEYMVGKSSPILVDGRLYGADDSGGLWIIDPATGEQIGPRKGRSRRANLKLGSMMRASLLWADGKIYACEANGRCHILKPTEDGVESLCQLRLPDGEEVHGSPIVSHGRIYLPSTGHMYCIGVKDQQPAATERPAAPAETAVEDDQKPAHVQVVPADVLMKPGEKVQFTARLFNARGQFLSQAEAQFSVDQAGQIDSQGLFTAEPAAQHRAVKVAAKAGDLTGYARIRIVPPLPWKFDFSDGQVPITWVGARYRHIALDFDLLESLEKQDPRASQLYIFVMTQFTNSGRPAVKIDDALPLQSWTTLQRFMGLLGKVQTIDAAKKELDAAFDVLKKEGVVAKWAWSNDMNGAVVLNVERGPRKFDGNVVMTKITTIPKGTRSQGWMGFPELHDYTIQADVRGAQKNNKFPEIGLIGQRYTLVLMSEAQRLQIRSWVPEVARRATANEPFSWNPNVWYTMKFRAANDGDRAVLKGKVWERGETEPADWMIELADDAPNRIGSPGLFGNASDAEIFLDNITVTPNE
jgi:outer membrane protein assembly factor BamB